MDRLTLNATVRTETGKGAARRLRTTGNLPAVVYNSKGEATMLMVNESEFTKVWKQATPTTLISLIIKDSTPRLVFIKATEYHIITDKNLHVDFHEIDEDKPLIRTMKILTSGNPVGVRDGGIFEKSCEKVEVKCMPKDLPIRITADISELKLNESILIKDLPFGPNVTVLTPSDKVIATVRPMH